MAAHKSGAPFDKLRVTLHDTLWVCHGELVESMTAKLHPLLNGYSWINNFQGEVLLKYFWLKLALWHFKTNHNKQARPQNDFLKPLVISNCLVYIRNDGGVITDVRGPIENLSVDSEFKEACL